MPQPLQTRDLAGIGSSIIELQSVDSTNNYARKLINEGLARHGIVIFTHDQFAGKGQRGKIWVAPMNTNLTLSVVLNPEPLQLLEQFQLSAAIAVACREFVSQYTGHEIFIKWPNDIYWHDRKAGGILIENIAGSNDVANSSNWKWAIAGIGINVNQDHFPDSLTNPVSIRQITGKEHDLSLLLSKLLMILDQVYKKLIEKGFDEIYESYLQHLYKRGEKVKLKQGTRVFETTIQTISRTGQLITNAGIEEVFDFGDVEWVIS